MIVRENTLYVEDFFNHILNEGYRIQNDEFQTTTTLITFSTDVNAIELDKNPILNKVKQFLHTVRNRFWYQHLINNADIDNKLIAFSIGRLNGRYRDEQGHTFDEHSKTLKILGLSREDAYGLADSLCKEFEQESVMVEFTENGKMDNPVFIYHEND